MPLRNGGLLEIMVLGHIIERHFIDNKIINRNVYR